MSGGHFLLVYQVMRPLIKVSSTVKSKIWTRAGLLKVGAMGYLIMCQEECEATGQSGIWVVFEDFYDKTTLKLL